MLFKSKPRKWGHASALAQRDVIGGPIRHPVPLLRDVMAAILVRFEWHGDGPGSGTGPSSYTLHPSPPNHRSVQQGLYLVEPHWVLAFGAGLLAIGAWLFAFLWREQSLEMGSGRTLVVPVSNLLVYALGPIALTHPPWVAVGMTVAAVLVIGARERMHGFVRLIPQDEVLTAGKFLILVGIILPLVPDTQLIAISPVTPYHIWLAVVAISSLSYLTYLVQRYRPVKGGALLSALLGGAYSSTATTVVLAKRQKEAVTRRPELSAGIIAATAIMYPRLAAVIAFFSPPIAVVLLPGLGFLFTVAAAISWWEWRNIQPGYADDLAIPAANPLQLTTALIFAVVFLAVSLATAWVQSVFGQTGIFTLAALSE